MAGRVSRVVVPGRFQPPHEGHVHLVRYAMSLADEVIVVIGSAQESHTLENPLTAGERIEILEELFDDAFGEGWCRRLKLVPVMDINMNKVWVQYLRMLLPTFEAVVSGNPLVRVLFEDMGFKAYKPPLYKRELCSGRVIRSLAIQGDPRWSECIPPRVRQALSRVGFVERLRRLAESDEVVG